MSEYLSDTTFNLYKTLIYNESGITFSNINRAILESRIKERLRKSPDLTPESFYEKISSNSNELKSFLDSVTTNLTRFFRNTGHFDALTKYVLPEVVKQKQNSSAINKTVRVWSAGCSTGEEPYTIAMLLNEFLPPDIKGEVIASDISLKSLMVGKQGFYLDNKVSGIPEQYLKKYFEKKEYGYQAKQSLMDMIRFDYHNLKHDSGQRNLDIVFCRNVLIYFDEAAQQETINRFWDAMAPHSYLFIGHSESLFGMKTKFEFLKTEWACLYQKK